MSIFPAKYEENNSFSDLDFKKMMTIFTDKCVEKISHFHAVTFHTRSLYPHTSTLKFSVLETSTLKVLFCDDISFSCGKLQRETDIFPTNLSLKMVNLCVKSEILFFERKKSITARVNLWNFQKIRMSPEQNFQHRSTMIYTSRVESYSVKVWYFPHKFVA